MLPRSNITIIEDAVAEVSVRDNAPFRTVIESHKGRCQYEELVFEFEYELKRITSPNASKEDIFQGEYSVRQQGHDFVLTKRKLSSACAHYSKYENIAIKQAEEREGWKREQEIWKSFTEAHRQELIDWLLPLTEHQVRFHMCNLQRGDVKNGCPSYSLVRDLDRGHCTLCTGHCIFREELRPEDEHSEEWYKLGIDKFEFKYI